jgi:hypothetical protein
MSAFDPDVPSPSKDPMWSASIQLKIADERFLAFLARSAPTRIENLMTEVCTHATQIRDVIPSALGCQECLKIGSPWVHLRLCRTCGHVGCCDSSPNKHATKHFYATGHPIIEGYDPPEGWGWCYVDQQFVELDEPTPHNGPIPRFY